MTLLMACILYEGARERSGDGVLNLGDRTPVGVGAPLSLR